jgi:hypothetical protein
LGFVGLAIQLWRDPFFPYTDFTTIWEAVALIDETVVIATGIRLIYLSMVATVLGISIATLILQLLRQDPEPSSEQANSGRIRGLHSFWIILLPVAALLTWSSVRYDGRDDFLFLGAFVRLSIGGGDSKSDTSECTGKLSGKTYVKLSEGVFHWHLYNQDGLFAIPHEELHRIEYKHCPELLYRN